MTPTTNAALMLALLAASAAQGAASTVHASRAMRVGVSSESRIKAQALLSTEFGAEMKTDMSAEMLASKPIRVARGGSAKDKKMGKKNYKHLHVGDMKCGETVKTHSGADKQATCPDECPFYAQDKTDEEFCTFRCVKAEQCTEMNPHAPIGDMEMGVCRSCIVDGCRECDSTATTDKCAVCQGAYNLVNGKCEWKYTNILYGVLAVVGVILLPVIIWVFDLCIRPTSNQEGLDKALALREAQKLRQHKNAEGQRELWPITTNLCSQLVAGPGMILHFNFQACIIVWAAFISLTWLTLALVIDKDLLILGTRRFGTPRENCILVAWGYERQKELMWTKVLFCQIAYFSSCILHFLYCVRQLRMFQVVDFENKTMKDYVAMIEDMPALSGSDRAEEQVKAAIAAKSGVPAEKIVGVSIAWDWQEKEEEVAKALHKDLDAADGPQPVLTPGEEVYTSSFRQMLFKQEKGIFGEEEEDEEAGGGDHVPSMLAEISSSTNAFVVFETEGLRDEAVEKLMEGGGFEVSGKENVTIHKLECEPDTVNWVNFGHSTTGQKIMRLTIGFGCIGLACLFWAIVFYAPYAWYVMNFNYENGRQPGFVVGFSFSMIVVIGNAIMYEVCARISDNVGFRFRDDREACYMILYTIACMFNVALDFVTTYYTSYLVMVGLGFRNYFGKKLSEIDNFTDQFETFAMQRALAENTYAYAFPSTFLIPFIIEPFVTIGLPLYIGLLIVRTHPEIQGRAAEEWVASIPLDMGRYADLILDIILGVLIFYFPGGYTATLFAGMAGSHAYIYAFDHWKILRNIPTCTIASMDIDWWSQALMVPIMGMMASCWVFKAQCDPDMVDRLTGVTLIAACTAAFVVHCIVQMCVLVYVVPMFGKKAPEEEEGPEETFAECAHHRAASWFTVNPIHCLRSKHFYKHSPSCEPFHLGKEHHMKVNKAIGCFFEQEKAAPTKAE